MTAQESLEDFERRLPQKPRLDARSKFPIAPLLYPRLLRQVADLIDALNALEDADPRGQEDPHFANVTAIPIFDQAAYHDRDDQAAITGWLYAADAGCWTFVPFVPEIDLAERDAAVVGEVAS